MLKRSFIFYIKGLRYCLLPFGNFNVNDNTHRATETEKKADISELARAENGWDRVKKIFEIDEFGNISVDANAILQVGALSMFVGALYGGVMKSKGAYMDFMENNQATSFETHLDAKRKLQDAVTKSFAKGAWMWSWRLTVFSTSFVGMSIIISSYRGKVGILEYVLAGGITGGLYKFNAGPRGWAVGSALGSILGLVCGGTTMGILSLTGLSMEEARYWQYKLQEKRSDSVKRVYQKKYEAEDFAIVKLHDLKVGKSGESLDNLDKSPSDGEVMKAQAKNNSK